MKQDQISIGPEESAGELHDKLMVLGSKIVLDTVEMIREGNANPIPQEEKKVKLAPKLNKNICRINWNLSKKEIFDLIRGLSPYPGAWTILQNGTETIELKIYRTKMMDESHHSEAGSLLISKKNIKVAVAGGYLDILELQMAGKRKMDAVSLCNGYHFKENCKLI